MKKCFIFIGAAMAIVLAALPEIAVSSPAILQMTIDTQRKGVAVLAGEIDSSDPNWSAEWTSFLPIDVNGNYYTFRFLEFPKVGTNWKVWAMIARFEYYNAEDEYLGYTFELYVWGQHMVKGGPEPEHEAEIVPNPLDMETFYENLRGLDLSRKGVSVVSIQELSDSVPHLYGPHEDKMDLKLIDLNRSFSGVMDGSKIAATIFLAHSDLEHADIPRPLDTMEDVQRDTILSWAPGISAAQHDVYLGTNFNDVNDANTSDTTGIYRGRQDPNTYTPPAALQLGQTYYWRIDEVNDFHLDSPWKGDVWSFTVEGRAKNLYPADGTDDVEKNVILRWIAGAKAKYHDVYFGTSESAVEAATTSSTEYKTRLNKGTEQYDSGSLQNPQVGKQYFWRIDEVNTITVKGYIWDFTAANWILVDDFDFYTNSTALRVNWKDSLSGLTGGGAVYVNNDASFAVDGNSMKFEYWNESSPYYSQTRRSYSKAQDWSYAGNGVTLMEINFFGDANNGPDPPMYVTLSDGTVTAQVNYPDFNDCIEEWQHVWNIPLNDFKGVTLSQISSIILGVGDKTKEGGGAKEQGTVYFDDIALRPPRCFLEYASAGDITEDCEVDNQDLDVMATDWLLTDSLAITETQNGTLTGFTNNPAQWVTGHIGGALEFDGVDDYVHVTDPRLKGLTSMSITAWVKQPIVNDYVGIVTSREGGKCAELGIYGGAWWGPSGLGYEWSYVAGAGLDVPLDTWTFVALSVDPNGATVYMRPIGGSLSKGTNAKSHPPLDGFSVYFDISRSNTTGGFYKGAIDDVRIYDWALQFADVNNLVYQIADPNPWPVYWYKFDETTGFTAADSGFGTEVYGPVPSKANLTDPEPEFSRSVNLRDYAILADEWLTEKLWPQP